MSPCAPTRPGAGVPDEIARGLAHRSGIIVAKAVQLAGEFRLRQLKPQLIEAFSRFLRPEPKSPDRGCEIKKGIVKVLFELELNDPDVAERVYLPGLRVYQVEWNDDAAAELRGACAIGLVAAGYRGVLVLLTDVLADRWPAARAGAARALGNAGEDAAALLLRLKLVLTDGDPDPDVAAECMSSLLRLWPEKSLEFVAAFLSHSNEGNRSAAALSLGAPRLPAALGPLVHDWTGKPTPMHAGCCCWRWRHCVCRKEWIGYSPRRGSGTRPPWSRPSKPLGIYRNDQEVRARLKAAIAGQGDEVQRAFGKVFR